VKYWLVVILLGVSASIGAAQDRIRIGLVDIQRVIGESESGKRARARFQSEIKKAEGDMLKERQDLDRLRAELDKKGPLLKDGERRSMEADFQKRSVNLQRAMGDLQQDLRQKDNAMMSEILKELADVVNDIGKAEKFMVILERSQILYSDQGTDITQKVIAAYNSRSKK